MNISKYQSYPSALDSLAQRIKARQFDPSEYYIVLTPDRYTQSVENALFGGGGAIDCEVLTLSRLARRIVKTDKSLSREGGVMLTARAIANVKDGFTYYSRAARFNDFARVAYEAIQQIASSAVNVSEIKAEGSTANKIHDLALIRAEYDRLKADSADSADRLDQLVRSIPAAPLVRNAHVYAIGYSLGYDNMTALNRTVFRALAENAKSFEYLDVPQTEITRRDMEVMSAPDKITQYKEVAARIRDYVYHGGRYGDVSVVCPSPSALSRILNEYGIAYYTDEATLLAETPPVLALQNIHKLGRNADGDTLVALAKNPFSGCDGLDAEKLQYALSTQFVPFGAFDKDYKDEGARRAVARCKQILDMFDAGSFADGVDAVVANAEFHAVQQKLYSAETDMITPITSLAGLLRKYGSGDAETDAMSFFGAARAVAVKSLPRKKDRVTVTVPQTLRLTRCKYLIVTDFNEGVLPAAVTESGLLSDAELEGMRALGTTIEPTVRKKNKLERTELAAAVCNAEKVFCTYTTLGGKRPATFIGELADNIIETDYAELAATLKHTDDAALIARYACVPSAARELATLGATKYANEVKAAVPGSDKTSPQFVNSIGAVPLEKVSVSELTHWFKCPYRRFLTDCVGLKERRGAQLAAPDFGIVVHEFMRRFMAKKPYDYSREGVKALLGEILRDKDIDVDEKTRARLEDDAVDYAKRNAEIVECGRYAPTAYEKSFRIEMPYAPDTLFVGTVDRIDMCGDRKRIIDYKTGDKKFKIKECLNGCDMQLPLYAGAVGQGVTGVFYVTQPPRYDAKDGKMSGCMLKDERIALDYDRSLSNGGSSNIVPVALKLDESGEPTFSGRMSKSLLDEDDFDALITQCQLTAAGAVAEMKSGYIERTPTPDACSYCAFGGICGEKKLVRGGAQAEDGEDAQ